MVKSNPVGYLVEKRHTNTTSLLSMEIASIQRHFIMYGPLWANRKSSHRRFPPTHCLSVSLAGHKAIRGKPSMLSEGGSEQMHLEVASNEHGESQRKRGESERVPKPMRLHHLQLRGAYCSGPPFHQPEVKR